MLTKSIRGVPHAYDLIHRQIPPELIESLYEGSAETQTLVFIHGWLLSRAYWQPLAQQLSASFHCLSYDMRGFGESVLNRQDTAQSVATPEPIELPSGRSLLSPHSGQKIETYHASAYSLAAYAKDLESLLDQLGLNQVWLLGHSLGGSIALWAAYLLPQRIKGCGLY